MKEGLWEADTGDSKGKRDVERDTEEGAGRRRRKGELGAGKGK